MVKCWICDTDIKDGYRSEEFLYHLEHEHVALEFDNSGTQIKIGASKHEKIHS